MAYLMKDIAGDLQCTTSFAVVADVIILIVYRRLTLNFCIQQWKESSFADKELNSRWTKRNFHFSVNGLAFIQFQWKVPENQRSHSFHFNHSKWLASTSSASTPKRKKWEGVYSHLVLPAGWIKHFRFIPQIIQMVQDIGIQKQNRTFGDVISFSKITNRKKKNLLCKHQWNTKWAFVRKLDIFTCENNNHVIFTCENITVAEAS